MKIRVEHEYIGAALIQIAEHDQFTAINAIKIGGKRINNAFKINNNKGLLCKYASEPNPLGEYLFTFHADHLDAIRKLTKHNDQAFIALICVQAAEICCLSTDDFNLLAKQRRQSVDHDEDSLQVLVTAEPGKSLRAYVNAAGKKGTIAGKKITVARNAFPNAILEKTQ